MLGAWMISPGLYQVNAVVPPDTPAGEHPLVVEAAGAVSRQEVVVTVGP